MTLKEKIKADIILATKERNALKKNSLKVIIGEVDTQEARLGKGKLLTDEEVCKIIRKTVQGIDEMLGYRANKDLEDEKVLLSEYLPKVLSKEELSVILQCKLADIKAASNVGQATGVAMKYLKEQQKVADGRDVTEIIKGLRE
jgi:uncharacterized protein